jgi:hypothetical protein
MQNEKKTSRNLSDLAFQKGIDKILTRVAFGTHRSMVNQWCEVDFHPWKSNLKLIIALPEQHYNYPSHTRQLCLHIGPNQHIINTQSESTHNQQFSADFNRFGKTTVKSRNLSYSNQQSEHLFVGFNRFGKLFLVI